LEVLCSKLRAISNHVLSLSQDDLEQYIKDTYTIKFLSALKEVPLILFSQGINGAL